MKKNHGINLLLISIAITTLGSLFKIMKQIAISEALLWAGMLTFLVALAMIIYRIARPRSN